MDIVHALGREASTFILNRAREVDQKLEQAKRIEMAGNEPMPVEQQEALQNMAVELRAQAQALNQQWGPGGLSRRVLTALTAAASGNVTGATEQFVQSGVVNLLQQHGAGYVGELVKSGAVNEGSPAHAALHALVGLGGAAASNQSLGAGALGGAVSSILTHAFSPTRPDETRSEQEAKHSLATTLVAGVAALTGADATVATHSAAAAIDNNWLATEQKALVLREREACEDDLTCKILTELKWTGVAAKQTTLFGVGFIQGVEEEIQAIPKGIAELILHPIETVRGLISLVRNKEVRAQVGEAISAEWDAKINRIEVAIAEGGDQNALQLGLEGGRLFCHVITAIFLVGGVADLAALFGRAGVRLSKKALEEVSKLSKFEHLAKAGSSSITDGKLLATASQSANITKIEEKLQYFFGKATGTKHNTDRSIGMLRELEKIGLSDTPAARQYLAQSILEAYNNPANIVHIQPDGIIVRHSLLMGPRGGSILETYWDGNRLTTGRIFKSKGGRYRHGPLTGE
ncbi:hypothetical protein [Mycoavidus sp. B2-EB]|uniref:hypothetical protein n=1 Tax=Mycoavidus sp. B2-EB TaxID=2651972 RepID=UPI00162AD819|nr:hypothetical protein [Mycoavidus sp. B2-EB]BBO59021.1 hypothetical protein MPB2EB_0122 [Mycoavidus sp. B2-EB]